MQRRTRRLLIIWLPLFMGFVAAWVVLSINTVQEYLILHPDPPLAYLPVLPPPPLPMDVQFTCVDGSVVSAEALRGQPAVINVFATWCPPCVAELPSLERLRAKVGDSATVLIVGLDDPEKLSTWLEGRNGDPAAFATTPNFPPPLDALSIPMTLVLDAQGNVVSKVTGAYTWDGPAVVERLRTLGQTLSQ